MRSVEFRCMFCPNENSKYYSPSKLRDHLINDCKHTPEIIEEELMMPLNDIFNSDNILSNKKNIDVICKHCGFVELKNSKEKDTQYIFSMNTKSHKCKTTLI